MTLQIMKGIPAFVRASIYAQTRRLLSTPYFDPARDREDLIQDLLLFYAGKFYNLAEDPDEAVVVTAIRHYASNLLRSRFRERLFLHASLEELMERGHGGDFSYIPDSLNATLCLEHLLKPLRPREQRIMLMISEGFSLNEVSRKEKISKNTIYRIFEKIKKKHSPILFIMSISAF